MIFKVETKRGFIEYEFKDLQSAKDYVAAFLSWTGTYSPTTNTQWTYYRNTPIRLAQSILAKSSRNGLRCHPNSMMHGKTTGIQGTRVLQTLCK